ncbi:BMP family protein [soil metagenome]
MNVTASTSRRTFAKASAVAMAAAVLFTISACSSRDDAGTDGGETDATTVSNIAIVAPENESDHGWNQAGLAAAQTAADDLGLTLTSLPDAGWDNTETVLAQVAADGAQFIIAHASGYGVAAAKVAADTGVPILIQDTGENTPGLVGKVTTEAEQGGYLAGIAAAMSTTSKTVGIVVSADDANWFKMSSGFAEGVYSVDPSITVLYASVGPAAYGDSAGGKATTEQLIAAGADVIFGMGDGATTGYLQAVEAAPGVLYIADIGDVTDAMTDSSRLLTSVLWNYADTYKQAIEDIDAGNFGKQGYSLTVENGGLSLQESALLTPEIQAAIDTAKAGIIDGSIKPTAAADGDAVKAVIAAK